MPLVLEEDRRGPGNAQLFHAREKRGQWRRKPMRLSPPTSAKNLTHMGDAISGYAFGGHLRVKRSIDLSWSPVPSFLCPPTPSSPAPHRRAPSRRCRSLRSPVGNPSRTAPAGPPPPSVLARRVCQRSARPHGRPPSAAGPASLPGAGGRAAERRSSGRGPGEARECPERVCPPWSRGEPGGAQGQWDSSGVSHCGPPSSAGARTARAGRRRDCGGTARGREGAAGEREAARGTPAEGQEEDGQEWERGGRGAAGRSAGAVCPSGR
ncbi:collagen alpha-1(I) chain-like [Corvus moneduloides]|uniref:collagen alpha-1(I) chain-like n=1 Tax=Corvus moneduloides TaxID=1196302 RepID=UPI001362AACC|nr:collagen alpha-1(I) chain-like [Corvus moneduloides]